METSARLRVAIEESAELMSLRGAAWHDRTLSAEGKSYLAITVTFEHGPPAARSFGLMAEVTAAGVEIARVIILRALHRNMLVRAADQVRAWHELARQRDEVA
jgi:hypothetical protein